MPIARASMMVRICCLSRGTTLCDQRSGRSGNILYSRSASIGGTRSRRANGGGGKSRSSLLLVVVVVVVVVVLATVVNINS